MELLSLLAGLSDPQAYPEAVQNVEVRQTHISIVFLTEDFAFKIRKPVKFSFLDFSSLELRFRDCEREVKLNQRLAPDVYLGVVPIVIQNGQIRIDGAGKIIEWAVKMRRLPEDATLKHRLMHDEVRPEMIQMVGRRLADFHLNGTSSPHLAHFGHFDAIARNVLENVKVDQLPNSACIDRTLITRLAELTRQRLEANRSLIEQRAEQGIPCDTHGDLRLDHVYLFPNLASPGNMCIIDCIEFNDEFRYADPVADIAFLIMDLMFYGHSDLADILTSEYFAARNDEEGRLLLPLYISYRSAIRAKVALLELAEPEISQAQRLKAAERARGHWLLALGELEAPSCRPCLILVSGLQGTGKTTLARDLAEIADFTVIRTDVIRKELAGEHSADSAVSIGTAQIYSDEWIDRTYNECLCRAIELLEQGQRVIVDGTFSRERHRIQFLDAARQLAVPVLILTCRADPQVVHSRLDKRVGDASDADWNVYLAAAGRWQTESKVTAGAMTIIDTNNSASIATAAACSALRQAALL